MYNFVFLMPCFMSHASNRPELQYILYCVFAGIFKQQSVREPFVSRLDDKVG